jgi:hypothetical protein
MKLFDFGRKLIFALAFQKTKDRVKISSVVLEHPDKSGGSLFERKE